MDEYLKANRALWNDLVGINASSRLYDVDAFRRGETSLKSIEREELGDVRGRSLLHLQCHFGMDTLSWAREGARVTGTDFSEAAIRRARALAGEIGAEARFVQANTYEVPDVLDERFDVVFTSYGVLIWLPDIARWACVVARMLRPGGTFYMAEFHPILGTLDDANRAPLTRPYFGTSDPRRFEEAGTYAEPDDPHVRVSYEWQHPVGEVVSALAAAGLRLEFLHEFAYSPWSLPWLEESEPGRFVLPGYRDTLPIVYSIRATLAR